MFKTLSQKGLAGTASVFALVAVCGGGGLWTAQTLSTALTTSEKNGELLRAHMTADMMHDALRADVLAALVARTPGSGLSMDDIKNDLREHAELFRSSIAQDQQLATTQTEREALQRVEAPLGQYVESAERLVGLAETDPAAAMNQLPAFLQLFGQLETAMEGVTEVLQHDAAASTDAANQSARTASMLMIALLVIGGLVACGLAFGLDRLFLRPVKTLTEAMTKLAGGDDSVEAPFVGREDEIGAMGGALAAFKQAAIDHKEAEKAAQARNEALVNESIGEGLSMLARGDLTYRLDRDLPPAYAQLKRDFNAAMDQLQQAMRQISEAAGGMRNGAGEISQAADDLSRRTEQQAASLEETAAALDEITATVRKTADGARQTNSVVGETRAQAQKSGDVVREAVSAMGEIEDSARRISQIIGVIDEIAFQTNLLALNAGVEAARAGEAGRGFAVVASEVRALAQRSSDAAKEIKTLIMASSQQVENGVDLVNRTGEALNQIVTKVAEISGLVSEISASTQEQSTGLGQVNTAINQMDQVTQQNAAMVEESTAASHSLAGEADGLSKLVAHFKIGAAAVRTEIAAQQQRVAAFARGRA
ncbi:MAG: methyl-accepting chemotaxis protein [Pseudomonadota bacterium]